MRVVVLIIFLFMVKVTHAQTNSIEGNWLTSDGERKIAVYKKEDKYFGKIVWVNDQNKSNEVGKVVITNLEVDGDEYENGTFIMPSDKHSASCSAKIKSGNVLRVSIYHGLKIFGHDLYLSKVN
ncbi:MAG: DUF2147 domain-containing protein [Bacteroidota bacterium]|nr:DUF2147 domain-containing protein [Bacteroidota bacterium]MDP3146649.1 DUF2147 domain-containing protein [Bacteroidota bacterium]